jgi:hypothetical protein
MMAQNYTVINQEDKVESETDQSKSTSESMNKLKSILLNIFTEAEVNRLFEMIMLRKVSSVNIIAMNPIEKLANITDKLVKLRAKYKIQDVTIKFVPELIGDTIYIGLDEIELLEQSGTRTVYDILSVPSRDNTLYTTYLNIGNKVDSDRLIISNFKLADHIKRDYLTNMVTVFDSHIFEINELMKNSILTYLSSSKYDKGIGIPSNNMNNLLLVVNIITDLADMLVHNFCDQLKYYKDKSHGESSSTKHEILYYDMHMHIQSEIDLMNNLLMLICNCILARHKKGDIKSNILKECMTQFLYIKTIKELRDNCLNFYKYLDKLSKTDNIKYEVTTCLLHMANLDSLITDDISYVHDCLPELLKTLATKDIYVLIEPKSKPKNDFGYLYKELGVVDNSLPLEIALNPKIADMLKDLTVDYNNKKG